MKKYMTLIIIIFIVSLIYQPLVPTSQSLSLNKKVIVLDPGHGGYDNGATIGNVKEDELNLKICYALKKELESKGATVYLTRIDDQDMTERDYMYSKKDDMYLRALKVDSYKPDLFLSIHLNSSLSRVWGSQVFYYSKSENGKILAEAIHQSMKKVTGTKKDISECQFYMLRATKSLGVLIECGFLSNVNERGQLQNKEYHIKLSKSITEGIEDYYNKMSISII